MSFSRFAYSVTLKAVGISGQIEPGLVSFSDSRLENGSGLFFQSYTKNTPHTTRGPDPHGATVTDIYMIVYQREPAHGLAVWCSGNALVSINAVALHRACDDN